MKKYLLTFSFTVLLAYPVLSQEKNRVEDPEFMEYFDEAYSIYLDGSNRRAGIKDLTGPETEGLWTAPLSRIAIYDISLDDGVMTIEKTLISFKDNWTSVDLPMTKWMGSKIPFAHVAEEKGKDPGILTGMFVDMSIGGEVTMSFSVKTDTDCQLRVDLMDANGKASPDYSNSQKIDLKAKNGWIDVKLVWTAPLFDYYSGDYWGSTNGMRDDSDPLWIWKDYQKTEKREYQIEEQTAVPVSMQSICKISMVIDEGPMQYPDRIGDKNTTIPGYDPRNGKQSCSIQSSDRI